ncbi:MAG: hypothetical protein V4710_00945 [Verrucomicrobiota bacterium]
MANATKDLSPIPAEWRSKVAAILRADRKNTIITTHQSNLDWFAAFPDTWPLDRYEALALTLSAAEQLGRPIYTMKEPGETWAFWFTFRSRPLYAKINLRPDGKVIIVYSSHIPRKGKEVL